MQGPQLKFHVKMQSFLRGEEGQDLVEYALLNALVAAIAEFFRFLGHAWSSIWSSMHFHF
jgi:Flp pilus assembly pilin Flp